VKVGVTGVHQELELSLRDHRDGFFRDLGWLHGEDRVDFDLALLSEPSEKTETEP
jgi:hypothetical protein